MERDLIFLEKYNWRITMKNGQTASIWPLYPSDEFDYRNFFYSLKEETIYKRFFYKMRRFSHEVAQQQWAEVDYHDNMSLIARVKKGYHHEVVAIGSYYREEYGYAEVAFVVHNDFQGQGLAGQMLGFLEQIAKESNFIGFVATVFG